MKIGKVVVEVGSMGVYLLGIVVAFRGWELMKYQVNMVVAPREFVWTAQVRVWLCRVGSRCGIMKLAGCRWCSGKCRGTGTGIRRGFRMERVRLKSLINRTIWGMRIIKMFRMGIMLLMVQGFDIFCYFILLVFNKN